MAGIILRQVVAADDALLGERRFDLGDRARAERVLEAYLKYVQSHPRLGIKGYGIGDVESLALLGRKDAALARLREAVDAGWRSTWPRGPTW